MVIPFSPRNKEPLVYFEIIFLWFTIPYNGWKMITGEDEDIVDEHWEMKVIIVPK